MLAAAVELDCSRISDYVKHRPLSAERVQAIEDAVEQIAYVWDTFAPFKITLDSPELLNQAFAEAQAERTRRIQKDAQAQLDQAMGEATAVFNLNLS